MIDFDAGGSPTDCPRAKPTISEALTHQSFRFGLTCAAIVRRGRRKALSYH